MRRVLGSVFGGVLVASLLTGAAWSQTAPGPAAATLVDAPLSPEQAARHAETLKAAAGALAALDELRHVGQAGVSKAFGAKVVSYWSAREGVMSAAGQEARLDPEVLKLGAAYSAAYARVRGLTAAPDTAELTLAQARDRQLDAGIALNNGTQAATARLFAHLEVEGFRLPPVESPELWAKGQTQYISFLPSVVAIHGPEFSLYPNAPWQVELQWADADTHAPPYAVTELHACGGALVAADWVVTAAHCVWDREANKPYDLFRLRVRAGSTDLSGAGMRKFPIDAVRLPGGRRAYAPSTAVSPAQNDIALVHIAGRAPMSQAAGVAPIAVAPRDAAPAARQVVMTVSGWGATVRETLEQQNDRLVHNGRLLMSPTLRVAPQQPISNADCARQIHDRIQSAPGADPKAPIAPLPATAMCAGSDIWNTCLGDSGGPLVAHGLALGRRRRVQAVEGDSEPVALVGIVSWGVGCQDFTVFTRVSDFDDWIASTVRTREAPSRRAASRLRR